MPNPTLTAEALGARLPPLLVAADRVAATVAQGVHGRRRVGQGDSFWQFRRFVSGDPLARIDWRQSAKSGRGAPEGWFIRETEWEAAQTVSLWRDASASMRWRSRQALVEKRDRANLLLLSLASLLLRGGERVMMMQQDARPVTSRSGLDRLAADLETVADDDNGLPPPVRLPRHGTVVLFSDFLSPLSDIRALIGSFAAVPVTGYLLQILDPAETALPYQGRIRFRGMEREGEALIPRVESVRDAYAERLKAQQDGLATICATAGFGFGVHRSDHPPEMALLMLHQALAAR
ncbi:DUF58 domain-containing protein [Acidisphaera sp. S103]|uniref:DUF58 domain-containing protein n=1 Tax=Acidisphaera sp. S103 TaxID=1747223 RepID=UPI00131DFB1B|nr:DUF58 domain-containing protein [Acidisphaera sp. S103]